MDEQEINEQIYKRRSSDMLPWWSPFRLRFGELLTLLTLLFSAGAGWREVQELKSNQIVYAQEIKELRSTLATKETVDLKLQLYDAQMREVIRRLGAIEEELRQRNGRN